MDGGGGPGACGRGGVTLLLTGPPASLLRRWVPVNGQGTAGTAAQPSSSGGLMRRPFSRRRVGSRSCFVQPRCPLLWTRGCGTPGTFLQPVPSLRCRGGDAVPAPVYGRRCGDAGVPRPLSSWDLVSVCCLGVYGSSAVFICFQLAVYKS